MLGNYLQQTKFSDAFFFLGALRVKIVFVYLQNESTLTAYMPSLFSGAKETKEASHAHSEMILTIMDEVRRQLGVVYPQDL